MTKPLAFQLGQLLTPLAGERYELLYQSLESVLELPSLIRRRLTNDEVTYLGDLLYRSVPEIQQIPKLGRVSIEVIEKQVNSLCSNLSLGCLNTEELQEFGSRRWLNKRAGQALNRMRAITNMGAPAELIQQLDKLGITEKTQLATCPLTTLAPLNKWRDQMERMLDDNFSTSDSLVRLGMPIPKHLNSNVKVYQSND